MAEVCPVCKGRGTTAPIFYEDELVAAQYASDNPEAICRACKGKGVI